MCLFGTDEYIVRVVERYSDMLLRLAMTRLFSPADAEDAVQEVFLRLLTAKPRFRDGEHEKAQLLRAMLQRASDIRRRGDPAQPQGGGPAHGQPNPRPGV